MCANLDKFNYLRTILLSKTNNPNTLRSRHIAGIWYNNSCIAIDTNKKKSHPMQAKFASRYGRIFIHAEIGAIIKALKHLSPDKLKKSTLYVIRVGADGKFYNSKPCSGCEKAIVAFEISNVFWSTDADNSI